MRPGIFKIMAAALVLLASQDGRVQAAEKATGFEAFRLVRTRNMFDPNRRPVRVETPTTQRSATVKQNRTSSLTLTGTMVTEGKTLAFFTGTRADYAKVLSVGDSIADGKITVIRQTEVELERAGKPTVLGIGHPLQIESIPSDAIVEPAPAAESAEAPADGSSPAKPAPAAGEPAAATAPANDKNEVLRRMMERREKEMSK